MTEHAISLKKLASSIRTHSIFSPSGSPMWAYCSGSLVPNVSRADTAGIEAAEGTVAHGVAECWGKSRRRPDHLVGTVKRVIEGSGDEKQVFDIEITDQMLEYISMYIDWMSFLPGDHYIETRVTFDDLTPIKNQGGTADYAVCQWQHLCICDFKYGIGVWVSAEKNTQLLMYAWGFFLLYDWIYDFQTIEIRICQPRKDNFDVWIITRAELIDWAAWLKERAYSAWSLDAPRTPGEKQCRFCAVKPDCPAFMSWVEKMTDGVFTNLDSEITTDEMNGLQQRLDSDDYQLKPIDHHVLTVQQKVVIYRNKSIIEKWLADIGADLYDRLSNGEQVDGYKLVPGKSSREFVNEQDAAAWLDLWGLSEDEVRPRVMISPAKAEELLLKHGIKRKSLPLLLDTLIQKNPGKPTMVIDSDPRPSVTQIADQSFGNLNDEL